ncbi:MarR family winged helix-turn-helix transcriptional regulator [Microbacterium sp. P07]|uniref:MarR family winged helix-turn-helix transcriptional regulator n=1 Tax=Microbacterium sp. P07 TaxID=3366952 RepID=UPI003746E61F
MKVDRALSEPGADPISSLIPAVAKAHRKLAGALLQDLGLAPGQELAMMLLWEESPRSQVDLTRLLMVEAPTTAKMLARLERSGMITRERSEVDRRVVLVSLTDAGRALEEPVTSVWRDLEARTTTDLTLSEQGQLRSLLTRVAETLTQVEA